MFQEMTQVRDKEDISNYEMLWKCYGIMKCQWDLKRID